MHGAPFLLRSKPAYYWPAPTHCCVLLAAHGMLPTCSFPVHSSSRAYFHAAPARTSTWDGQAVRAGGWMRALPTWPPVRPWARTGHTPYTSLPELPLQRASSAAPCPGH